MSSSSVFLKKLDDDDEHKVAKCRKNKQRNELKENERHFQNELIQPRDRRAEEKKDPRTLATRSPPTQTHRCHSLVDI